jgi:ribonuclease-3
MATAPTDLLSRVQAAIGYSFHEPRLLESAIAHASVASAGRRPKKLRTGNERQEFLGDRVLGLIVAEMLMLHYPDEPEGGLSRRHAQLVRRETLAEIGEAIGLGAWLDEVSPVDAPPATAAVLADTLEALLGAIYLDGGLAPAQRFIDRHWATRIEAMAAAPRDPKTALQEWAQARSLDLPAYRVVASSGPKHAPSFEIEVTIADLAPERGEGASKRIAEQMAASRLLSRLGGALDE